MNYIKDNVLFVYDTKEEHDYLANLLAKSGLHMSDLFRESASIDSSNTWRIVATQFPGGTGIQWFSPQAWFGYVAKSTKPIRIEVSDLMEKLNA